MEALGRLAEAASSAVSSLQLFIEAPGREPGHLMMFVSIDTLLFLFFQIRLSCVGGSKEEY